VLGGSFHDGTMTLSGEATGRDRKPVLHQITWRRLDDGRVRQHWRASGDGGKSWNDVFVGFYRKK
jgi:hypothetical protein